MLRLPIPLELVIEAKETSLARTVNGILHSLVSRFQDPDIQFLIIIHYADRARVNASGTLAF